MLSPTTIVQAPATPAAIPATGHEPGREPPPADEAKRVRNSTAEAYAKDVRLFISAGGSIPCTPDVVRKYISAMRLKVSPGTLHRRLVAISHEHKTRGLPTPTDDPSVRPIMRALQLGKVLARDLCVGPEATARQHKAQPARPLTRELLTTMLDHMGRNLRDRRDCALLLLGFATAMRRAELVALNVGDFRFTPDAMLVQTWGRRLAVPITNGGLCAARAVKALIEHAALETQPEMPIFVRFDRGGDPTKDRLDSAWVSVTVKCRLKLAGIDPGPYSAESLRRGRKQEAAKGVIL